MISMPNDSTDLIAKLSWALSPLLFFCTRGSCVPDGPTRDHVPGVAESPQPPGGDCDNNFPHNDQTQSLFLAVFSLQSCAPDTNVAFKSRIVT